MTALKDKGGHLESDGYGLPYFDNGLIEDERGIFKYKDVKEKVLEFEELLEIEIIFSKFLLNVKQSQKRIKLLRKEFKEIFGDFEK